MHISSEKTIFMQKAIYYVSRLIAARGILELTDRHINFQVSNIEASFGIKDLSIDFCTIDDVRIEGGELYPKIVVHCDKGKYEFVLAKAQELYDRLKELRRDPLGFNLDGRNEDSIICSECGKQVNTLHRYCPWCGEKLSS